MLTVSSYSTRTSPVLRGKWVLDNLLAAPPPDPPAGVPRLDESTVGVDRVAAPADGGPSHERDLRGLPRRGWTRWASASRTSTPSAPGGRRTASSRSTPPARCPTAGRSTGPAELKAVLRQDDATRSRAALTEKLLTYALGRGLERYDRRHGQGHRAARGRERLPLLGPGAGDRRRAFRSRCGEETEDAHDSDHRASTSPRRTFLRGVGRHAGPAPARRHAPGLRRPRPRRRRRCAWPSSTCPNGIIMPDWTPAGRRARTSSSRAS